MRQLFMLCVTWTALAMLCSPQTVGAVARPKELRPLPGAKHVKYGNEYEGTISYELTEPYPAAHAIDLLRPRFKRDGWRELAEDFLNPGIPNSFSRGWVLYEDARFKGGVTKDVHQWDGQWSDVTGRILWYTLKYVGPVGDQPGNRLEVLGVILSADAAHRDEPFQRPKRSKS